MKTALRLVAGLVLLVLVGAGALYAWARHADDELLSRTIETHRVNFPMPFPLSPEELETVRAERSAAAQPPPTDADLGALALDRARTRGEHLVEARYGCTGCHGASFGGGTMIDDPMIGSIHGPNITNGAGGRTAAYTAADWDRIVRHGVRPDGTPAAMPSGDFRGMSDHELSDIVVYIRAHPAVDDTIEPVKLGPLGAVLLAVGRIPLSADMIEDHRKPHPVEPPPAEASVAFGAHLANTCSGCHGASFSGGPIPGGPPDWPPAANLTSHAEGLSGWTYDQFASTLRTGRKRDGTGLRVPMSDMVPSAQRMTDVELQAIWAYLQSLPPRPTGG
jgi:mono/diheme cytochrome c family protein